jgi:hypothetical protein
MQACGETACLVLAARGLGMQLLPLRANISMFTLLQNIYSLIDTAKYCATPLLERGKDGGDVPVTDEKGPA